MATDQQKSEQNQAQEQKPAAPVQPEGQQPENKAQPENFDGLKDKKPEELTPEELRLMADTMPGEGPGD